MKLNMDLCRKILLEAGRLDEGVNTDLNQARPASPTGGLETCELMSVNVRSAPGGDVGIAPGTGPSAAGIGRRERPFADLAHRR